MLFVEQQMDAEQYHSKQHSSEQQRRNLPACQPRLLQFHGDAWLHALHLSASVTRRITDSDGNGDSDTFSHSERNSERNRDSNRNGYSNRNVHSNTYPDTGKHANSDPERNSFSDGDINANPNRCAGGNPDSADRIESSIALRNTEMDCER